AGALVASVAPASPAARAGLKSSDLIIAIDGQPIDDPNAFDYRFATKVIGGSARIGVVRAGKELAVTVALEALPDTAHDGLALAVPRGQGVEPLAGARRRSAARPLDPRRGHPRGRQRLVGAAARLPARRPRGFGQQREDRQDPRPRAYRRPGEPALEHHHPARRPAGVGGAAGMTPPRSKRGGPSLFAAAGLERDAPRPLADKLRPTAPREGVGPEQLPGPHRPP